MFEACFHCLRKLTWIPMLLWWSDILSTAHSIDILFLFINVWGLFLLHILLLPLVIQKVVWDNCFHEFCFWCKVAVRLHETHYGFSRLLGALIVKSLVQELLQFQMVLLILEQSFCDDSSSNFLCQAIPSGSFWMGWSLIVFYWLFLFLPIHGQPMLLLCH